MLSGSLSYYKKIKQEKVDTVYNNIIWENFNIILYVLVIIETKTNYYSNFFFFVVINLFIKILFISKMKFHLTRLNILYKNNEQEKIFVATTKIITTTPIKTKKKWQANNNNNKHN